ncbi:hypothetical protein KHQ06_21735 [Nocardia tengchongensis]|uniref:Uncharacterized protein n=1 Tax=Nocardia tengchongensis TaxID=2055889 RepID=A0ABX8CGS3_9NOCA|nr:hypothetical protein [Nocardia tengchongensis]QVI19085.1 hypothetical protein KHQ06_21735 [Nocardia tengchongensis]
MSTRDSPWNRWSRFAYLLQVVAVGALALAWAAIGIGLYSDRGADPRFELEAGGRFEANLAVYWPFLLVISPLLAVTGMFGLLPYRFAPGGTVVGGVVASLFAQWVGTELYLSDYKRELPGRLETSFGAACFAVAVAFTAAFLHLYSNRSGRTRVASIRGGAGLAVAILVSAWVTIPPLIAGSGTQSGVLAGFVTDPHCGRKVSDWTDEGRATVYKGDATTQSYPPKDMPDIRFGVVVTLRNGMGSVETTPPTAVSFRDELPFRSGPPATELLLSRPNTGNGFAFTRIRDPKCETGSNRVVSATYIYDDYGRTNTPQIRGTVSRSE